MLKKYVGEMYIGLMVMIIAAMGVLMYKQYKAGRVGNDYIEVCIQGHSYHYANFAAKAMLAINLDDDGKPVRCD